MSSTGCCPTAAARRPARPGPWPGSRAVITTVAPMAGERDRSLLADAGVAAGDDDDLAVQVGSGPGRHRAQATPPSRGASRSSGRKVRPCPIAHAEHVPGGHGRAAARRRARPREPDAAPQRPARVRRGHVGLARRPDRPGRLPRRRARRRAPRCSSAAARRAARTRGARGGRPGRRPRRAWCGSRTGRHRPIAPKRFLTYFFAGPAPEGAVHIDGGEIHGHAWMTADRRHAPTQRARDRAVAAHLDHPRAPGRLRHHRRGPGRHGRSSHPSGSPPGSPGSRAAASRSTTAMPATTTRTPTARAPPPPVDARLGWRYERD